MAEKNRPLAQQARRLRRKLESKGVGVMIRTVEEARFRLASVAGPTSIDLTNRDGWRGTVVSCPGTDPVLSEGLLPDESLLERVSKCATLSK